MRARDVLPTTVLALAVTTAASAEVKTHVVDYAQDGTPLQGMIAWNDVQAGKRPGVLIVHEWWGHNDHARNQARRLAEAGYVAFALDMYGKGKLAAHPDDAMKFMAEATRDPAVMKARFDAALALFKSDPHVDPSQIAAIGYCFGGGVVLNMAAAGEDLRAVVTFHGVLSALGSVPSGMKPRVLVLTGGADPEVPPDQLIAFKQKMTAAGAHFDVVVYPGAKHSFTNPEADKAGMPELGYNAEADKASFAAMLTLFKQVFH